MFDPLVASDGSGCRRCPGVRATRGRSSRPIPAGRGWLANLFVPSRRRDVRLLLVGLVPLVAAIASAFARGWSA